MATSRKPTDPLDDDVRPEYDFSTLQKWERGKYAARYREGLRVVRLADDVGSAFTDEAAVNAALREYLRRRSTSEVSV